MRKFTNSWLIMLTATLLLARGAGDSALLAGRLEKDTARAQVRVVGRLDTLATGGKAQAFAPLRQDATLDSPSRYGVPYTVTPALRPDGLTLGVPLPVAHKGCRSAPVLPLQADRIVQNRAPPAR